MKMDKKTFDIIKEIVSFVDSTNQKDKEDKIKQSEKDK